MKNPRRKQVLSMQQDGGLAPVSIVMRSTTQLNILAAANRPSGQLNVRKTAPVLRYDASDKCQSA